MLPGLGEQLRLVYSLRRSDPGLSMNTAHLITTSNAERLAVRGQTGWEEVCNPLHSDPQLCGEPINVSGDAPFAVYAEPAPGRSALYRCETAVDEFLSLDNACEGRTQVALLGYLSDTKSSATPRPLRRCFHEQQSVHFHWLTPSCPSINGVREEGLLGYVR